jgi:salicylate hydroxylase
MMGNPLTIPGMGGLTSALALAKAGFNNIDVYETASNLGFVGAGIQLAPNMARVLDKLGVWKDIEADAVVIKETSVRRESPMHQVDKVADKKPCRRFNWPRTC